MITGSQGIPQVMGANLEPRFVAQTIPTCGVALGHYPGGDCSSLLTLPADAYESQMEHWMEKTEDSSESWELG